MAGGGPPGPPMAGGVPGVPPPPNPTADKLTAEQKKWLREIHDKFGKPFEERAGLVFIGGFQHPPNTDAVLWYAQDVLPHVRAALPYLADYAGDW